MSVLFLGGRCRGRNDGCSGPMGGSSAKATQACTGGLIHIRFQHHPCVSAHATCRRQPRGRSPCDGEPRRPHTVPYSTCRGQTTTTTTARSESPPLRAPSDQPPIETQATMQTGRPAKPVFKISPTPNHRMNRPFVEVQFSEPACPCPARYRVREGGEEGVWEGGWLSSLDCPSVRREQTLTGVRVRSPAPQEFHRLGPVLREAIVLLIVLSWFR